MKLRKTFAVTKDLHSTLSKHSKKIGEQMQTMIARALKEQASIMGEAWLLLKQDNEKKKVRARLSCVERATRKIIAVEFQSPEDFAEFDKMSGIYTRLLRSWLSDQEKQKSLDFEVKDEV